jgi:hypothetical protein
VLEYASNVVRPDAFADIAVAIARWFHDAYLAWEDMGPGIGFKAQIIKQGYYNCYYREVQFGYGNKKVKKLGYINRGDARTALFLEQHNAVCVGDLVVRSKPLCDESPQYVVEKGKIEYVGHKNATDDAFGEAHGDRVIAMGVAYQALKDRPLPRKVKAEAVDVNSPPPEGCMARRQWERNIAEKGKVAWDTRSSAELTQRRFDQADADEYGIGAFV